MNPSDHLQYFAEHPHIKSKQSKIKAKGMTTGELFKHVEQWANDRGLNDPSISGRQALKVMEEVGETMAALARGNKEALADGIGDSIVTLIILATQCGLDPHECLNGAYNEIKDRKGKMVDGVFIKDCE